MILVKTLTVWLLFDLAVKMILVKRQRQYRDTNKRLSWPASVRFRQTQFRYWWKGNNCHENETKRVHRLWLWIIILGVLFGWWNSWFGDYCCSAGFSRVFFSGDGVLVAFWWLCFGNSSGARFRDFWDFRHPSGKSDTLRMTLLARQVLTLESIIDSPWKKMLKRKPNSPTG